MSDARIEKLESKIDKISDSLHSIDKTLARQEENLKEHMRRSAANERAVEILAKEMKPIKAHINRFEGALKVFGVISAVGSAIYIIFQLYSLLKG